MIDAWIKRAQGETPVDNYEEFTERLLNASADLKKRKKAVSRQLFLLNVMLKQNMLSYQRWKVEYGTVHRIQAAYDGGADGYRAIGELVDTAERMTSLFGNRVDALNEKAGAVTATYEAIDKSIDDLEASVSKLALSKTLHDDKAKLLATESALRSGQPSLVSTGHELSQELHNAREAVAMAEALLEVKGL